MNTSKTKNIGRPKANRGDSIKDDPQLVITNDHDVSRCRVIQMNGVKFRRIAERKAKAGK